MKLVVKTAPSWRGFDECVPDGTRVYSCGVGGEIHMEKLIGKLMGCKQEVGNIAFDDDTSLDALLSRTRMYMSKLRPDDTSIKELNLSMFKANLIRDMWGSTERAFQLAWEEGKKRFDYFVDQFIEAYELDNELGSNKPAYGAAERKLSNNVFIIHGHDEGMKKNVARVIEKLGLHPIILHEQEDKGRTIIEKFEYFANNVGYAIALLSPDDLCIENNIEIKRARQNVVFELGYFTGLFGRDRTFALVSGSENVELMSDYQGIVYKIFDQEGAWRLKLVKELKAIGYNVSADSL